MPIGIRGDGDLYKASLSHGILSFTFLEKILNFSCIGVLNKADLWSLSIDVVTIISMEVGVNHPGIL
jgi:hypothetical protein